MRSVDRPSGASCYCQNVELLRQSVVSSQRTHGTSRREGDNIRKDTEGNVNEAFHRPWSQTAVPRMDQYILHHPSNVQSRTALAPPPVNVPQPMASLLNGDLFASLKRLKEVNYLDIYPSLDRRSSSEPARPTMCAREVQRELAGMPLFVFIHFNSFVI